MVIRQFMHSRKTSIKVFTHNLRCIVFMLPMLLLLAGCGEDAFVCDSDDCASSTSGGSTGGTATDTQTATGVRIGSWSSGVSGSGSYNEGDIYTDSSAVTAGNTATIQISLVEDDYSQYTPAANIDFTITFTCADSAVDSNPATASAGSDATVTLTYTAGTVCAPTTDTVTATAVVDGDTIFATVDISIL